MFSTTNIRKQIWEIEKKLNLLNRRERDRMTISEMLRFDVEILKLLNSQVRLHTRLNSMISERWARKRLDKCISDRIDVKLHFDNFWYQNRRQNLGFQDAVFLLFNGPGYLQ